ncbi:MAG: TonB-dependent receptor [Balneolaceae bacterium]|nr:MAG: TonB-dependent receptor [Balneolaceae bacterium]
MIFHKVFKIATFCFISLLLSNSLFANQGNTAESDTTNTIDQLILDRITVVGNPVWMSRIPGAASYVSAQQLQKQNYTDINRILRTISGINIQEEDGFGLRPNIGLRGAGVERSTKVNIMEDGILVAPAPYSAPAAYYFPNMGRISSVEVRKGSSQIKYGPNSTGGAINLISTPIPTELSGKAEVSVGERSANKLYANFGNRTGRFGYLVEVLQMGDDGFKKLDNGGNTGYILRDITGKFMVRSADNASIYQRLEFKVGYHEETSDETYLGLTRGDFENSPLRRYAASQVDQINVDQFQFSARHFAIFSDNVDLTTTLYRQNVTRAWYKLHDLDTSVPTVNNGNLSTILGNPDANPVEMGYLRGETSPDNALNVRNNSREYYSQGIQSLLGVNFDINSAKNQLEFGVRLHQDEEDRFQEQDGYRMQDGVMILTRAGVPGTQANRVGSATALSIFVQNKIELERWTFKPGLRYENIWFTNRNYGSSDLERTGSNLNETKYTTNVIIPGIGVTFQATDNLTLISGIHRGFSPPSPGSSSETVSESSINYELGARLANHLFQAEIIGFYNDYSNLLGSDLAAGGGGGSTAQFNAGEVEVYGLEVSAILNFAELLNLSTVSLPFNANYTFTSATFQSEFASNFGPWGSVTKGDEIPFIPKHQFNAGISLDYKNFSTHLNSVYSPQVRTLAGQGAIQEQFSTDSYFLLDLSSSYGVTSSIDIFMNVRNILNNTYIVSDRPSGVRPGLPRTVMGGVRYTL